MFSSLLEVSEKLLSYLHPFYSDRKSTTFSAADSAECFITNESIRSVSKTQDLREVFKVREPKAKLKTKEGKEEEDERRSGREAEAKKQEEEQNKKRERTRKQKHI